MAELYLAKYAKGHTCTMNNLTGKRSTVLIPDLGHNCGRKKNNLPKILLSMEGLLLVCDPYPDYQAPRKLNAKLFPNMSANGHHLWFWCTRTECSEYVIQVTQTMGVGVVSVPASQPRNLPPWLRLERWSSWRGETEGLHSSNYRAITLLSSVIARCTFRSFRTYGKSAIKQSGFTHEILILDSILVIRVTVV